MSQFITYALIFFLALTLLVVVFDFAKNRDTGRLVISIIVLALVVFLLNRTTGFPTWIQSFGGTSPLIAILVMLGCIVLGMFAHYVYFLGRKKFRWYSFLRPLVVSPIVLLPLLGTVEVKEELSTIQVISFALLAFQNGFFWQAVMDRAQPQT